MLRTAALLLVVCLVSSCAKPAAKEAGDASTAVSAQEATDTQQVATADELGVSDTAQAAHDVYGHPSHTVPKPLPGTDAAIAAEMRAWDEAQQASRDTGRGPLPDSAVPQAPAGPAAPPPQPEVPPTQL